MLPVFTAADALALEAKNKRRSAARMATVQLASWMVGQPDVRYAVGNLPVVWHALAVEGKLACRIDASKQELAQLPQAFDRLAATHRLTAMQRFDQNFVAALHAA